MLTLIAMITSAEQTPHSLKLFYLMRNINKIYRRILNRWHFQIDMILYKSNINNTYGLSSNNTITLLYQWTIYLTKRWITFEIGMSQHFLRFCFISYGYLLYIFPRYEKTKHKELMSTLSSNQSSRSTLIIPFYWR